MARGIHTKVDDGHIVVWDEYSTVRFPLIEHPVLRRQRWHEVAQKFAASVGSDVADRFVAALVSRSKRVYKGQKPVQLKFGDNDG